MRLPWTGSDKPLTQFASLSMVGESRPPHHETPSANGPVKPLSRRDWLGRVGSAAAAWSVLYPAWGAEITATPRLAARTLLDSMHDCGRCCLAWLNPQKRFLPTGGYEVSHDTGRWWDAILRLQATTGFAIPQRLERAMLENFRVMTDNPVGLLNNDARLADLQGSAQANPHNFRETMLASSALVQYRDHAWSREQGRKLVESTGQFLESDGQMDYERLAKRMNLPLNQDLSMIQRSLAGEWFDATGSTGRAIEGFVRFYEATKDDQALELATRLTKVHARNLLRSDGKVPPQLLDPKNVGHNHSFLGTLRGLLLFGLTTGNQEYVQAVGETYRDGLLNTVITESGWSPHDLGKSRFANEDGDPVGEHGSCSDAIQLALWLGLQARQPDLLDDVERLIRSRLWPAQIDSPADPRQHGAWGVYGHPYGRGCILDVFAAVLHVLTQVYQSVVVRNGDSVSVHLHFTIDTPLAEVESVRGEKAQTRVTLKEKLPLRIRVPRWAPRTSLKLTTAGQMLPLVWEGSYLRVPAELIQVGSAIELQYELPKRSSTEVMPVSHRQFHLTWRGDEVVACDPAAPIYQRSA